MIIVGLGKANHDCNISLAVDGVITKYAKYERDVNVKSMPAYEYWFYKKLHQWNIDTDKVDLWVHTDSGSYRDDYNVPFLPHEDCIYWKKQRNNKEILLDHHTAHVWSNLSYNNDKQYVIVDGEGSNNNKVLIFNGKQIIRRKSISPGGLYIWLTNAMNIHKGKFGNSAGKVMGIASYGKRIEDLFQKLVSNNPDDYLFLTEEYIKNFFKNKKVDSQECMDFIKTIDDVCFEMIKGYFQSLNKQDEIIYSGGCALNVEWNRKLKDMGYKLNIEPPTYDGGLSLGCVRFGHHYLNLPVPNQIKNYPYIQDDEKPDSVPSLETIEEVADLLANGKIVGWYQGNGELGPRALGNRSILMNPKIKNCKDILNKKVKHREWWRPYGASVLEEKSNLYFSDNNSPYMLFNMNVLTNDLPGITHIDNTCRPQTVNENQNKYFYLLLKAFERKTGLPILLNTSLNLGGDPIVSNVELAKNVLNKTELDALCVGDLIYKK